MNGQTFLLLAFGYGYNPLIFYFAKKNSQTSAEPSINHPYIVQLLQYTQANQLIMNLISAPICHNTFSLHLVKQRYESFFSFLSISPQFAYQSSHKASEMWSHMGQGLKGTILHSLDIVSGSKATTNVSNPPKLYFEPKPLSLLSIPNPLNLSRTHADRTSKTNSLLL